MDISEEQIEALEKQIQSRQNKARQRTWLLTIIPVAFAGLLLGYTIWQISTAQKKLADTESALNIKNTQLAGAENELSQKRTQVPQAEATLDTAQENLSQVKMDLATAAVQAGQLQAELATATAQIEQLNSLLDKMKVYLEHACPIKAEELKGRSDNTPQAYFLLDLLEMQMEKIPWNPSGFSKSEGFDSPNFALFALQTRGFLPSSYQPGTLLWNILPPTTQLENGDIVYDVSGYTMFYYRIPISYSSYETMECVIGMTPLGIQALKIDFVPKWSGYLKGPFH